MTAETFYPVFLEFSDICIDSRAAKPGSVFIALKGDNFNGNNFAALALESGCERAVVDEADKVIDERYVLVDDSLAFLQDLARFHRRQMNIPVLALTGTNGKTTTKELITAVLSEKFKLVSTKGNFNNHIGVPLTILRIRSDDELAVVEMGASHAGEISLLCSIAQPTMGLITNIGNAHLEGFGSFEGVIAAKKELYDYLKDNEGVIFYNYADKLLAELIGDYTAIRYNTDRRNEDSLVMSNGTYLSFRYFPHPGEDKNLYKIDTHLVGAYNITNVLAALSVGEYFDVPPEKAAKAIAAYEPGMNRSQFLKTADNELILDAYNANPTSMREAINNIISIQHDDKLLILGDMLELGDYSCNAHKEILDLVEKAGLPCLLVGSEFEKVNTQGSNKCFANAEKLAEYLTENPVRGKLILIKGSRGIALERVVEAL